VSDHYTGQGNRVSETLPLNNVEKRTVGDGGLRRRHPADFMVAVLLVGGFFLGPLKLLGTSWLSYLGADGFAFLTLLVVFRERIATRKPLLAESPLSVPLLLLAAFCVLELANPEAPFIRSVLGLRSWVMYLGFYFVGLYTLRSVGQLERLYALLLSLGVLTAVYGVFQLEVGPQSFANWSEYYGQYAGLTWSARGGVVFRAFSTFVTPGAFGGNMSLLMFLAFSATACPSLRPRWRILGAAAFVVMGVGIAASGSRGALAHLILAGALALALISGVGPRARAALIGVLTAGVAVVAVVFLIGTVISERFSTIFDPQAFFWKWFGPLTDGIRVAYSYPFGMGLGYTAGVPKFIANPVIRSLPAANIDSGYGSAAAELGFLGLGFFVYFSLNVAIHGFRSWKQLRPGRLRDLLLGPALYAITYPIVSLVFQPQAALPSSIYSWLLIGILIKAPVLEKKADADQLLGT